ncbi:KGK family protein [Nostocales cyanobacterium HT-58-2]|nr:KGK family protein [Nostocales cyanobacterium HT-58-2]
MNEKFIPLECDDDVILLDKDSFKVSRLKELIEEEIRNKLQQHIYEYTSLYPGVSMLEFLSKLSIGQKKINLREIQHNYVTECQLLKVGGYSWQKGKLKIQICTSSVTPYHNKLYLEFCPDEPTEQDFLLDEICKIIHTEK